MFRVDAYVCMCSFEDMLFWLMLLWFFGGGNEVVLDFECGEGLTVNTVFGFCVFRYVCVVLYFVFHRRF